MKYQPPPSRTHFLLHRMRRLIRAQRAGEYRLDAVLDGFAITVVRELHADAGGAGALGADGGHPYHLAGHGQAFGGFGEGEQEEDFVAQEVALGRGDEDAAALHEGHVGVVEGGLVLDGERQDALATGGGGCVHRYSPCFL